MPETARVSTRRYGRSRVSSFQATTDRGTYRETYSNEHGNIRVRNRGDIGHCAIRGECCYASDRRANRLAVFLGEARFDLEENAKRMVGGAVFRQRPTRLMHVSRAGKKRYPFRS